MSRVLVGVMVWGSMVLNPVPAVAENINFTNVINAANALESKITAFANLVHYKDSFHGLENQALGLNTATEQIRAAAENRDLNGVAQGFAALSSVEKQLASDTLNCVVEQKRAGTPDGDVFNQWFFLYGAYFTLYRATSNDLSNHFDSYQQRVSGWYPKFLNRPAIEGDAGLESSAELLREGVSANDVLRFMLASDEFYNLAGGTPVTYAQTLYLKVSGQTAPDDYVSYVVASLAANSSPAEKQLLAHQLLYEFFPDGAPNF